MNTTTVKTENIRVYWLLNQMSRDFQDKNDLLIKNGYVVQVFNNIESLISMAVNYRPSVIVLDTAMVTELYIQKCINLISKKADLKGVRKILSVHEYNESLYNLASANVFRDILPLNIEDSLWMARFYFATSRKNRPLSPPKYQLKFNEEARLSFPARITWISEKNMFIETRVNPEFGQSFYLEGSFNDTIKNHNTPRIELKSTKSQDNNLMYRFSKGILVKWDSSRYPDVKNLFTKLKQTNFGPKIRVFVISKTPELRTHISSSLDSLRFEVNVALRVQSIYEEPKYFSPHIIFIEDSMCKDPTSFSKIEKMIQELGQETYIYIVGKDADVKLIPSYYDNIKVFALPVFPPNLSRLILTQNILLSHDDKDRIYLGSDHPYSLARLSCDASITALHSTCISISTPFKLIPYGLCTLESKTLNKDIRRKLYSKIYRTYTTTDDMTGSNVYGADCYLCDLTDDERAILTKSIQELANISINYKDNYIFSPLESIFTEESLYKQINIKNRVSKLFPLIKDTSSDFQQNEDFMVQAGSIVDRSEEISQIPIKAKVKDRSTLKIAISIILMIATLYTVVILVSAIAPMWTKSGSEYTESLRKMAPDKFKKSSSILEDEKDFGELNRFYKENAKKTSD